MIYAKYFKKVPLLSLKAKDNVRVSLMAHMHQTPNLFTSGSLHIKMFGSVGCEGYLLLKCI